MIEINNSHALRWAVIGWLAERGTLVYWSAPTAQDARNAFNDLIEIMLYSTGVTFTRAMTSRSNGAQEICLVNGSRVVFRSRASRSVRGFAADKLVIDGSVSESELGELLSITVSGRPDVVRAGRPDAPVR
jgi:hypothetical protein